MPTFFMNYALGQHGPTHRFNTKEQAEKEAERLTMMLGVKVYTLMAVTCSEKMPQVLKREMTNDPQNSTDDLPF